MRKQLAIAVSVTFVLVFGTVVWSQTSVECAEPGWPSELFCFSPNQPAMANQVNGNFKKLVDWVENKTGDITSDEVSTTAVHVLNTSALNPPVEVHLARDGDVAMSGGNTAGNLHLEAQRGTAFGDVYLNWYSKQRTVIGGSLQASQGAAVTGNLSVSGVADLGVYYKVCDGVSATGACYCTYPDEIPINAFVTCNGSGHGLWAMRPVESGSLRGYRAQCWLASNSSIHNAYNVGLLCARLNRPPLPSFGSAWNFQ